MNQLILFYSLMMIEAYASLEQTMDYYGNESTPAGHFPFNFLFITNLNNQSTAHDFRNTVNQWMQFLEIQLAHSKKCVCLDASRPQATRW